eukprot:8578427-Alexandrium_andersonii.AAC.1
MSGRRATTRQRRSSRRFARMRTVRGLHEEVHAGQPADDSGQGEEAVRLGQVPVSYTHLTLPTICSV